MIQIHGKEYITVAERIDKAKDNIASILTEVLYTEPTVVIKATVTFKDGRVTTGISAANSNKLIEKESPFEVAETSAVGRALAFAGYETQNGIASAEEIKKAEAPTPRVPVNNYQDKQDKPASEKQKAMIFAIASEKGINPEDAKEKIKTFFKLDSFSNLTMAQAKKAIDNLLKLPVQKITDEDMEKIPND
jgi:hypothetical protein